MVSIPACHAGDRGSIPRRGDVLLALLLRSARTCVIFIRKNLLVNIIGAEYIPIRKNLYFAIDLVPNSRPGKQSQ